MKAIYKVTFEVEADEAVIEKYLNHKRWGKDASKEWHKDFIPKFMSRHIEAGFCRVKLPLAPYQRSLDWVFKFGRSGFDSIEITRVREKDEEASLNQVV